MSISIDVDTSDFDSKMPRVIDTLRSLPHRIVLEGAEIVQPEMANQVPVRTGFLRASIDSVVSENQSITSTNAFYALFVDQGTKPHWIEAHRSGWLRWEKDGQVFFRRKVYHPGFEGRQFIAKTVEASIGKIRDAIERILGEMR